METRNLVILGSTGSIGTQALEVAEQSGWRILGLAVLKNITLLEQQIRRFHPAYVTVFDENAAADLRVRVKDTAVKVYAGMEGLCALASLPEAHRILVSVVGMVGLKPTLAAIEAGKDVALANKETLVAGGSFVTEAVKKHGTQLLPVDSEHSAIFQCLQGKPPVHPAVKRLILTASGGPFFGKTRKELEAVTLDNALAHPNWSMGPKVTIDSATMMNKGLELIEAHWLFAMPPEKIDIVVHRESIVHSLVEYDDNAVVAQLGVPDMRIPIQYALTYPQRLPCPVKPLRLEDWGKLTFFAPDDATFPTMNYARQSLQKGTLYPTALNAANEVAVKAFINGKIRFLDIPDLIGEMLEQTLAEPSSVEDVFETDATVRRKTEELIRKK